MKMKKLNDMTNAELIENIRDIERDERSHQRLRAVLIENGHANRLMDLESLHLTETKR
jgi:1,4-dihydroxy-2-naphthoate octaprenyltransferase